MHTPNDILRADAVTIRRDDKLILDDVSWELTRGQLSVGIGPNGAGKSTLLSVLSGILRPDNGSVTLDGRKMTDYQPMDRARKCAVMKQNTQRPASLTVLETVELGCLASGNSAAASREIAWEALRRMDMVGRASQPCRQLSGGEWQRAEFARTWAQIKSNTDCCVVLLDEPASSLDPAHQHQLLNEARLLAAEGHAVFAILHDINLTAHYAQQILMMKEGKLCAAGPATELMNSETLSDVYGCLITRIENASGLHAFLSNPSPITPVR
jgi:iron complex transport system ATP-binding protein